MNTLISDVCFENNKLNKILLKENRLDNTEINKIKYLVMYII